MASANNATDPTVAPNEMYNSVSVEDDGDPVALKAAPSSRSNTTCGRQFTLGPVAGRVHEFVHTVPDRATMPK